MKKILVVNPGSTSTKIGLYHDLVPVHLGTIVHASSELARFADVHDQYGFRRDVVLRELERHHLALDFDAVIGRGGIARPVPGGAYAVSPEMIADCLNARLRHACNLGCKIAHDIAALVPSCRALVAEPGVVDELMPVARVGGHPEFPRHSLWHALNQRAVARRYAREVGRSYADLRLVVAHLGGGISIAAHDHGRAVDVNHAMSGDGPFTPERSGALPVADVVRLCFSGRYTEQQLLRLTSGEGGMVAHLGTNDLREAERRMARGDDHARLVVEAMAYQVAKAVCALGATFGASPDAILLTGGLAHSTHFVDLVTRRVAFLAPVRCYPGEDELGALAEVALAVLRGDMVAQPYG